MTIRRIAIDLAKRLSPVRLRILHAPCHGPSLQPDHIDNALTIGAHSTGFSEGYNRVLYFRSRPGYRCVVSNPETDTRDERRGAGDTPILTKRKLKKVGSYAVRACNAAAPIKIAPPRYTSGAMFTHAFGEVEHINLHPHAAIRGVDKSVARVREYARQMADLETRIKAAQAAGRIVVVTGDLNFPVIANAPSYSPQAVFARCGLEFWAHGIDYIAWDPKHLRLPVKNRRVIPTTQNGQDHPWLSARFKRAGR